MTSIYAQTLGRDFERLHPRIRERFGWCSADGVAAIGEGEMYTIWHAPWAAAPLAIGARRHILFPHSGRDIPFTVENYAYRDRYGRETVTWIRTFRFADRIRRFDATMIRSARRGGIVDYLGTRQHLAVDLELAVSPQGGLRIRSGEQRVYEGRIGFRWPNRLTGAADVHEWYDEEQDRYRIEVKVANRWLGPIFYYSGAFRSRLMPLGLRAVPLDARPLREEARE
ncbi:DUF4166 domain-containing protein [Paenibacillus sp. IB182496]|uniref:DUF4166 domain-containing protein n=1 Tax=Paenibacillus sabuli TaxID=2772509 RepID=A0A927BV83_9BACL|nr:DUF4166 domain-containing protein [Paenibacillus sabuli]MBD2845978.1 DUF4166 domain-containing protein [Paenibacillus sabuli]